MKVVVMATVGRLLLAVLQDQEAMVHFRAIYFMERRAELHMVVFVADGEEVGTMAGALVLDVNPLEVACEGLAECSPDISWFSLVVCKGIPMLPWVAPMG